jgi:hypothetical protein
MNVAAGVNTDVKMAVGRAEDPSAPAAHFTSEGAAAVSDTSTVSQGGQVQAAPPALSAEFSVPEVALARQIGLSRAIVKTAREKMPRGMAWETVKKNVMLTPEAARAICATVGVPEPRCVADTSGEKTPVLDSPVNEAGPSDAPAEPEKTQGLAHFNPPLGIVEEFTVLRANYPNKRVLLAVLQKTGTEYFVRVADNTNFHPVLTNGAPMTFRAKWDGQNWMLVGRCPRGKGRW